MTSITPHARRGFTLVETVMSMTVMIVLMAGLASATLLASRAIPSDQAPVSAMLEAHDAAEQIANELFCAQAFSERTPTAITFTVADRDADAVAETIRYAWSGTVGEPLTRKYNSGTVVNLVEAVYEFDLQYDQRSVTTTESVTTTNTTAEAVVASFAAWGGIIPGYLAVNASYWAAEYFAFNVPAETSEMTITRVQLMMRNTASDPNATVSVAIHETAVGGNPEPQPNPLGTPSIRLTSSLSNFFEWTEFTFSDVVITNPANEYVIVVSASAANIVQTQRYYWKSAPNDTNVLLWTTDSGASWNPINRLRDDYEMPFRVFATFSSDTTQDLSVTRNYLQSVRVKLRTGQDASTRVRTASQILNEPEVTGG